MATTMMMGRTATDHEEEKEQYLRAMSLPDLAELTDIVGLDKVIHGDDDDDINEAEGDSPLHPVRVVSLGLHRSMSMPKQQQQQQKEESKKEEEEKDDFFFPDDESVLSAPEDSFLPKFYSNETLAGVIPPPGVKLSPRGRDVNITERIQRRKTENNDNVETAANVDVKESGSDSPRKAASKKSAQREAALSSLSAFFGGGPINVETEQKSPTSTTEFPSNDLEPQSHLRTRSKSLRTCSGAGVSTKQTKSPPRRTIFGNTYSEPQSPSSSNFEFNVLQDSDRTTSMPAKLPSTKLPRKPSLKKVSSFVGNPAKTERTTMKQSVSFSNLQIREYDLTLGDHPSCSFGPPVSLGWDYQDAEVVPLEKYEKARSNKFPRRKSPQLRLSYNVRKYLLLKTAGYTKAELREAMKEVERIKHERKMTDMMRPLEPLDEVMEGVIEHVKGMFQKK